MNNSFDEIYDKLKISKKVLMTLHTGPDGDSLGSCSAMKYFLERDFNCDVTLVSFDGISETLNELDFAKEVLFGKDILDFDLKEFDVLVALDSGTPEMIGRLKSGFEFLEEIFTINIDHHKTNNEYGDLHYVGNNLSTCSVLIDFFNSRDVVFDRELSRRLLLGVCTDTNFLRRPENIKSAFEDIAYLLNNGADYNKDILEPIVLNTPLKLKKYFAYLIDKMQVNEVKRFGYSAVPIEVVKDLNVSEIRLGIYEMLDVKGLDFVFSLVETTEYVKGSFRSKGKVDVSKFALKLGGGGHEDAAAFRLKDVSLDDAERQVLEVINEIL